MNYANDYSDGVRGVDTARTGPLRLTASGLVAPAAVRRAAVGALVVAAVAGIALAVAVNPWLVLVGAIAIAAAVLYSGGPRPYGAAGWGEVSVLVFFGFVATCGSAYVQLGRVPLSAVGTAVPVGLLACAILIVNNLRDVESDRASGKRTLAVRVGADRTRRLYAAAVIGAFLAILALVPAAPGALLGLAAAPLAVDPLRRVAGPADSRRLVAALVGTARLQLLTAILLAVGLWW